MIVKQVAIPGHLRMLVIHARFPEEPKHLQDKTYAYLFRKEITILVRSKHKAMNLVTAIISSVAEIKD